MSYLSNGQVVALGSTSIDGTAPYNSAARKQIALAYGVEILLTYIQIHGRDTEESFGIMRVDRRSKSVNVQNRAVSPRRSSYTDNGATVNIPEVFNFELSLSISKSYTKSYGVICKTSLRSIL